MNAQIKPLLVITALFMIVWGCSSSNKIAKPQGFTNIKVLPKNISHADLKKAMGEFSRGLGVKCNYCHAASADGKGLDFASDAKPEKDIARRMYTMTQDINRRHFNHRDSDTLLTVTCFTCHSGNEQPAKLPPPPPRPVN